MKWFSRLPVLAALAGLLVFQVAQATPRVRAASRPPLAAIMLLDTSGSMAASDPQGLRFTAARLFLSLLEDGDQFGVIAFSSTSQVVTRGLETIGAPGSERQHLLEQLQPLPTGGLTDLRDALHQAEKMLGQVHSGTVPALILLTDGRPEGPQAGPEYDQDTLALAQRLKAPILAVALTPSGRSPLLESLAEQTHGRVLPASQADALLDVFLSLLGQVTQRVVLPNSPGGLSFNLDADLARYVDQASFVLVGPLPSSTLTLESPNGQSLPLEAVGSGAGARYSQTAKQNAENDIQAAQAPGKDTLQQTEVPAFAFLTVPQPAAGQWIFRLPSGSSSELYQARLLLNARLRLQAKVPQLFEAGTPLAIQAEILEELSDGSQARLVGQADISAQVLRPDRAQERLEHLNDEGAGADRLAGDGQFSGLYPRTDLTGIYTITVQAWKGLLPLTATLTAQAVRLPILSVEMNTGTTNSGEAALGQALPLQIRLRGGSLQRGGFQARILPPNGAPQQFIPLTSDGRLWRGQFTPQAAGVYSITIQPLEAYALGLPYHHSAGLRLAVIAPPAQHRSTDTPVLSATPASTSVPQAVQPGTPARPWKWWGVLGALSLLAGLGWRIRRSAVLPGPWVTGVLTCQRLDTPGVNIEIDLTSLHSTRIELGGPLTPAQLVDLAPKPLAALQVEVRAGQNFTAAAGEPDSNLDVLLYPLGEVHQGYRRLTAPQVLRSGDTFSLGGWTFRYISDEGILY